MLVEFSVKNFYSIKDKVTLSMVADEQDATNADVVLIDPHLLGKQDIKLLPSAVIYGPNASGKTTLLAAIDCMIKILGKSSHSIPMPVTPFLLSKETENEPTEFDIIFTVENIRYQYGFSLNTDYICGEWLYSFENGKKLWFKRDNYDPKKPVNNQYHYEWGRGKISGDRKKSWAEETNERTLFLYKAGEDSNNIKLKPIFQGIVNKFLYRPESPREIIKLLEKSDYKQKILTLLASADLGIIDFDAEKKTVESKKKGYVQLSRDSIENDKVELVRHEIKMTHISEDGKKIIWGLENESKGTEKLFSLAGSWISALEQGRILFIDELNDSLHPFLTEMLIKMFHNPKLNKNNAQLIFTTHDASLLARELGKYLFRRDQIWLTDKNKDGSTKLYSLAEYKIPENEVNIDRSYLGGRYGGLPFVDMSLLSKVASKKKSTKKTAGKGFQK